MQARRAPGRIPAMAGMLGLVLSLAFWCWGLGRRTEPTSDPQTSAADGAARPAGEEKPAATEPINPESAGPEAPSRESSGRGSAKLNSVGSESAGSASVASESDAAAEGKGGVA